MRRLRCRPMRRLGVPGYPGRLEALADPSLLREHAPAGWLSHRELAGALGLCLAANSAGCMDEEVSRMGPKRAAPRGAAIVAPIFAHGEGHGLSRGGFACVVVTAPAFLSEEEALQVIAEELGAQGILITRRHVVLPSVVIRGQHLESGYDWLAENHSTAYKSMDLPLAADLADQGASIVVEYVAANDFNPLGGADEGQWDTDIKGVAQSLANAVTRNGRDMYFGAFYDPMVWNNSGWPFSLSDKDTAQAWDEAQNKATAEAKRLLRLQVKDFVDWLKAQGAI